MNGDRPWRRLKSCVENWPECEDSEYNPHCCRFPKSCSCLAQVDEYHTEEDFEPESKTVVADAVDPLRQPEVLVLNDDDALRHAIADAWCHWTHPEAVLDKLSPALQSSFYEDADAVLAALRKAALK